MNTLRYVPQAAETPYVIEYYYKVRWGCADKFIDLFRKNHYPVLEKQLETGRILEIRSEQPRYHNPEADRWDYRVTLVFRNMAAAHDKTHEPELIRAMYADAETFHREEHERFEMLLAHWDLPITTLSMP